MVDPVREIYGVNCAAGTNDVYVIEKYDLIAVQIGSAMASLTPTETRRLASRLYRAARKNEARIDARVASQIVQETKE